MKFSSHIIRKHGSRYLMNKQSTNLYPASNYFYGYVDTYIPVHLYTHAYMHINATQSYFFAYQQRLALHTLEI
jgi:hypothetical protein